MKTVLRVGPLLLDRQAAGAALRHEQLIVGKMIGDQHLKLADAAGQFAQCRLEPEHRAVPVHFVTRRGL